METLEVIRKRRSVRFYTQKPINEDDVRKLIEAALWAPSAHRMYGWRIVIIQQQEIIGRINAITNAMHGNDPAAIMLLCRDTQVEKEEEWVWAGIDKDSEGKPLQILPDEEHIRKVAIMDIAIVAQNICLMATELGIGSCMIAGLDSATMREMLGLPDYIIPELMVCLGYQDKAADTEWLRTVAKTRRMKRSFEHTVIGWIKE